MENLACGYGFHASQINTELRWEFIALKQKKYWCVQTRDSVKFKAKANTESCNQWSMLYFYLIALIWVTLHLRQALELYRV